MNAKPMHVGEARLKPSTAPVRGDLVVLGGESFYRIAGYDRMGPFFMSLVSASDHWLFISSLGGLTAGRRSSDNALFPYYTEDKLHDSCDHTGSRTILRVIRADRRHLWEPFSRRYEGLYDVARNLYKNVQGNRLIFEELNHDLGLAFRYTWSTSDRFGFVKHSELESTGPDAVEVEVLDGLENLQPWGLAEFFQERFSCLGDAYKDNDLALGSGVATYALSSLPGDSTEPTEVLRANVCWSTLPRDATRLLSSLQLDAFRRGEPVVDEPRVCGRRGAFFVAATQTLEPGERQDWLIVADVDYGLAEIASLESTLAAAADPRREVLDDVREGTRDLAQIVARADGLQATGDRLAATHHFSNVLFNLMRGGVFESGYSISMADLEAFVRAYNRETWKRHQGFFRGLGERVKLGRLRAEVRSLDDPDLLRLVLEYLPLSFSRRHGDPSRPWNRFSIHVRRRDGSRVLDYQGNWRDIFQNWEALCLSFPEYLEGVIGKFLNTTTADGYNPYRVTRDGYDWEAPSPDEPWANFGYWGDHQLIYLLKLLEAARAHHPGDLEGMLDERRFVYADVPYDIKPHDDLVADPRSSIAYNTGREAKIAARVEATGFDGRYLTDPSGEICRANLAEKLLVPLLAKVSNLVPGAGFWLNTQRPEWNDANNALAGYGASVVTLGYARRYLTFCIDLFRDAGRRGVEMSGEVARWLRGISGVLSDHTELLEDAAVDDAARRVFVDALGRVAEGYRAGIYANGLSGRGARVAIDEIVGFLERAREFVDQTLRQNRRTDGLYHAYNVLEISARGIGVERLTVMLEGQVAVLSSGALTPGDALSVLGALRESDLYRADQHSYLLYPDRVLPGFRDKNTIPAGEVDRSALVRELIAAGNTDLVEADVDGRVHFNGLFRNVRDVRAALDRLRDLGHRERVDEEEELVCEIFESVFEHRKFTGRSGTFYGYEGLGCIYWHMVSKLLLAVQECCRDAASRDDPAVRGLAERYYDVRAGLGFNKTPEVYGAFPTDPYSHTPGFAGARQPGMTGQVKEEILTRFGELGVVVRAGRVGFEPLLLRRSELLPTRGILDYYDIAGEARRLDLDEDSLAFTYCQVPVVYRLSGEPGLTLHLAGGDTRAVDGLVLDRASSAEIFRRSGKIVRIDVSLTPGLG